MIDADGRCLMICDVVEDVALRDPAFTARARDRCGIEVVLFDELAHGRPHLVRGASRGRGAIARTRGGGWRSGDGSRRRGGGCGSRRNYICTSGRCRPRRSGCRFRRRGRSRFRCGRSARRGRRCADLAGLQHGEHLPARDDGAVGRDDLLQHTVGGRRHFEHDLVRLEVDEVLVTPHGFAGLLVPGDERGVRHGLGELRNLDLDAHWRLPLCRRPRSQARLPTVESPARSRVEDTSAAETKACCWRTCSAWMPDAGAAAPGRPA